MVVDSLDYRALRSYARKLEFRLTIARQTIADYKSVCENAARLLGRVRDITSIDITRMKDWINEFDNAAATCRSRADYDPLSSEYEGEEKDSG